MTFIEAGTTVLLIVLLAQHELSAPQLRVQRVTLPESKRPEHKHHHH